MISIKVLVPSGVLGLGFDLEALKHGIENNPDIISIDGGSTDSGPFSLGSGTSKYSRAATKAEWKNLMIAREKDYDNDVLDLSEKYFRKKKKGKDDDIYFPPEESEPPHY